MNFITLVCCRNKMKNIFFIFIFKQLMNEFFVLIPRISLGYKIGTLPQTNFNNRIILHYTC